MPEQEPAKPTISLGDLSFDDYKTARVEGKTEISAPPAAGEESPKEEIKEKPSAAPEKAAKPDSDSETDEESEPRSKGKGGFQRRIDKLTEEKRNLARQIEELRTAKSEPKTEPKTEPSKSALKPEQFPTYEDYIDARIEEKRKDWQAAESQRLAAEHIKNVWETYQSRTKEFAAEHDDFNEVVKDQQIPNSVGMTIIKLKNGPAVAYYLGQNPDVCQELTELAETEGDEVAIAELGVISRSLMPKEETPVRSKEKQESKLPEPIKPVGARSSKSTVSLADMPYDDYKKARLAGRVG